MFKIKKWKSSNISILLIFFLVAKLCPSLCDPMNCSTPESSVLISSWITTSLWQRGWHNSVKLWAILCRATQDPRVIVKSSDKTWPTGEGNGKPHGQYEKGRKTWCWKMSSRSEGIQYATREEQRVVTNGSSKNEAPGPKQELLSWHSAVDVSGGESKAQYCKEQYCIGTWNVRSMNQGKLDMVM